MAVRYNQKCGIGVFFVHLLKIPNECFYTIFKFRIGFQELDVGVPGGVGRGEGADDVGAEVADLCFC